MFTTREGEIASDASVFRETREDEIASDANVFHVTPREEQGVESRRILFCHVGLAENSVNGDTMEGSITELLKVCNGLPVSLAAAGKSVKFLAIDKGGELADALSDYVVTLRDCRELRETVGDYRESYTSFEASISLLEKRNEEILKSETPLTFGEMHRRLCVLEKQGKAAASMLRHLWKLKSEEEARTIGRQFKQVGLAEVGYTQVGTRRVWYLGMHDSLHDFAVKEAKRNGDVRRTHWILLNGYIRSRPNLVKELYSRISTEGISELIDLIDGRTAAFEDDWYIRANLFRHLKGVGFVMQL